ncbi:Enoyl-CoA hydratase [Collimonas arenae]|uniref:Enoyl-CoA hydratase n=1 Tax=Collimonas arenae TaxID=279058 RepID=A0A0A1F6W8_9BURK|nr:methylmalonyl-CoA decarboxylase [Collimonas arenae]AIY39429.1 Enoyl-CoA hydratase [Collimonas arenae]
MSIIANEYSVAVTSRIVEKRIGQIVFSNPSRRHALSADLLGALEERLAELAAQHVPVLLLGSGVDQEVWSAGHDLGELAHDRDPIAYGKPLERVLRAVRSYPGVVIAMVSGSVWGGAVDLAMSCDLVVADRSARFAMTPANIGLPYTTSGLLRFFRNLPIHVLKEMFFCAMPLSAERAAHFGVINCLAESSELEATALELARGIADKAPLAIRAVKEQLRILEDFQPLPVQAMEQIAELRRQACASADFSEGLEAFSARRQPLFRGM